MRCSRFWQPTLRSMATRQLIPDSDSVCIGCCPAVITYPVRSSISVWPPFMPVHKRKYIEYNTDKTGQYCSECGVFSLRLRFIQACLDELAPAVLDGRQEKRRSRRVHRMLESCLRGRDNHTI